MTSRARISEIQESWLFHSREKAIFSLHVWIESTALYSHLLDSIIYLPKLDLVLDRSIIACLLGLFNTERLASEMSAVTRVIDILQK